MSLKRVLNGSGVPVTAIGLGAMPLSIQGRPSEEQAFTVIKTFIEGGGNFIDTANVYCLDDTDIGHNERLVARSLKRLGEEKSVRVATKGGLRRPQGKWMVDASPKWLRTSCEKSLQDLDVGAIFLYQLHSPDERVKLEDSMAELIQLRQEGKILYLGLSNVTAAQLEQALHMTPIVSVQNRCNPFQKKDFRNGLIELCHTKRVAYIPHSPVGGHSKHANLLAHPLFQRLTDKYAASPYCISLAWLLGKGEHIIPIPGASKASSIQDSLQAQDLILDTQDRIEIDHLPDF